VLRSVPGIDPVVTATLLADLPERGTLGRKALAAVVVGVAQLAGERGRRATPMRTAFCQRLRAAGKPAKVCLTACMHTVLTIVNAMVRDGRPWAPRTPAA